MAPGNNAFAVSAQMLRPETNMGKLHRCFCFLFLDPRPHRLSWRGTAIRRISCCFSSMVPTQIPRTHASEPTALCSTGREHGDDALVARERCKCSSPEQCRWSETDRGEAKRVDATRLGGHTRQETWNDGSDVSESSSRQTERREESLLLSVRASRPYIH
ncbi:hypothetical protein EDB85DRAFT_2012615, partial [Lactarius pseudohatsudake]